MTRAATNRSRHFTETTRDNWLRVNRKESTMLDTDSDLDLEGMPIIKMEGTDEYALTRRLASIAKAMQRVLSDTTNPVSREFLATNAAHPTRMGDERHPDVYRATWRLMVGMSKSPSTADRLRFGLAEDGSPAEGGYTAEGRRAADATLNMVFGFVTGVRMERRSAAKAKPAADSFGGIRAALRDAARAFAAALDGAGTDDDPARTARMKMAQKHAESLGGVAVGESSDGKRSIVRYDLGEDPYILVRTDKERSQDSLTVVVGGSLDGAEEVLRWAIEVVEGEVADEEMMRSTARAMMEKIFGSGPFTEDPQRKPASDTPDEKPADDPAAGDDGQDATPDDGPDGDGADASSKTDGPERTN